MTLSSGSSATDVLVAFIMQDKLLWVSFTMWDLSDAQAAAIHTVLGMERAHVQWAKAARMELPEYLTAHPQQWKGANGHMANALPPQADIFKQKMRASTWEDTKPHVAGTSHYSPTKGMTVEAQKAMIIVAVHVATARLRGRHQVSIGEPIVT